MRPRWSQLQWQNRPGLSGLINGQQYIYSYSGFFSKKKIVNRIFNKQELATLHSTIHQQDRAKHNISPGPKIWYIVIVMTGSDGFISNCNSVLDICSTAPTSLVDKVVTKIQRQLKVLQFHNLSFLLVLIDLWWDISELSHIWAMISFLVLSLRNPNLRPAHKNYKQQSALGHIKIIFSISAFLWARKECVSPSEPRPCQRSKTGQLVLFGVWEENKTKKKSAKLKRSRTFISLPRWEEGDLCRQDRKQT